MPVFDIQLVMQLLGGLLTVLGGFIAFGAIRMRLTVAASNRWPTVAGIVRLSEVVERSETNSRGRPIKMYGADISYEYQVGGRTFTSAAIMLGGALNTSRRGGFDALVARYPVGHKLRVYYDPSDPSTAILEPGKLGGVFNIAMVALGFMTVGVLFFAAGYFRLGH